jgi:hypothetical protein
MLNRYLQDVQGFIRDRRMKEMNPADLVGYINRARREIAERTQCLRVLIPISGPITAITVNSSGSGYTNPKVTISTPDQPGGAPPNPAGKQATATISVIGGQISNISLSDGGDGYFQPTVTITDPTGTGATATAQTSPIGVTQFQQEVYPFSAAPLSNQPGIGEIFAVQSVSLIYANYRYSLPIYPFSIYQAMIRQYPQQYIYVPTVGSQYGQGASGSFYLYPLPSQAFQMQWDCYCLPSDLIDNNSFEAIPQPWQDAVAFGATAYAFMELQNLNTARFWQDRFDTYVHRQSAWARIPKTVNIYGRF